MNLLPKEIISTVLCYVVCDDFEDEDSEGNNKPVDIAVCNASGYLLEIFKKKIINSCYILIEDASKIQIYYKFTGNSCRVYYLVKNNNGVMIAVKKSGNMLLVVKCFRNVKSFKIFDYKNNGYPQIGMYYFNSDNVDVVELSEFDNIELSGDSYICPDAKEISRILNPETKGNHIESENFMEVDEILQTETREKVEEKEENDDVEEEEEEQEQEQEKEGDKSIIKEYLSNKLKGMEKFQNELKYELDNLNLMIDNGLKGEYVCPASTSSANNVPAEKVITIKSIKTWFRIHNSKWIIGFEFWMSGIRLPVMACERSRMKCLSIEPGNIVDADRTVPELRNRYVNGSRRVYKNEPGKIYANPHLFESIHLIPILCKNSAYGLRNLNGCKERWEIPKHLRSTQNIRECLFVDSTHFAYPSIKLQSDLATRNVSDIKVLVRNRDFSSCTYKFFETLDGTGKISSKTAEAVRDRDKTLRTNTQDVQVVPDTPSKSIIIFAFEIPEFGDNSKLSVGFTLVYEKYQYHTETFRLGVEDLFHDGNHCFQDNSEMALSEDVLACLMISRTIDLTLEMRFNLGVSLEDVLIKNLGFRKAEVLGRNYYIKENGFLSGTIISFERLLDSFVKWRINVAVKDLPRLKIFVKALSNELPHPLRIRLDLNMSTESGA